jgi:hypothetical protein
MIVVYAMDGSMVEYVKFNDSEFSEAMIQAKNFRNNGFHNVVISSEPENMVGGFGVDSVEDGKLPNGNDYQWKKRRI